MTEATALAPPARAPATPATRGVPPTNVEARASKSLVAPHDLEAERAVLGAVLLDATTLHLVRPLIGAEAFYHPAHAVIFECMVALCDRNEPIDVVTLSHELRRRGRINAVGGMQFLGELTECTPTTAHVEQHAQVVAEYFSARRIATLGQQLVQLAHDRSATVDEIIERGTTALATFSLVKTSNPTSELGELFEKFFEQDSSGEDPINARPTGLRDLDKHLSGGGLRPGQLITIAGRPAMGKSSLAQQLALSTAVLTGRASLYFSMEMTRAELFGRTLCAEADVDSDRLAKRTFDDDEHDRLLQTAERLYRTPLVFCDESALSFSKLRAMCLQQKQKRGELGMIVIDYLQLMQLRMGRDDNRARALGDLTRELKVFAGAIGCPIVILSQLNRDLEKRPNKRPMLSDLRESGSIENDSDTVVFVYRDEVYDKQTEDRGVAELIVGKQRGGPPFTARTRFRAERLRFFDLDESEERETTYTQRTRPKRSKKPHATATEDHDDDR